CSARSRSVPKYNVLFLFIAFLLKVYMKATSHIKRLRRDPTSVVRIGRRTVRLPQQPKVPKVGIDPRPGKLQPQKTALYRIAHSNILQPHMAAVGDQCRTIPVDQVDTVQ